MMRLHRALGHTSFTNLAKLLQRRGAPAWAVTMARGLQCPACIESSKPLPSPPASTSPPGLYEIVGTDVFEYTYKNSEGELKKMKGCIWVDRASRLCAVSIMKIYSDA